MWVLWALVTFAVLGWLGFAWIAQLKAKYEHTRLSFAVLAILGIAASSMGWGLSRQIAPDWGLTPRLVITVSSGFVLFCLFSFLAISLWRALLSRDYDERVALLEEEEDALLRRIEVMRWSAARAPEKADSDISSDRVNDKAAEAEGLRAMIEAWEQGGGAARIRSIKVLEWRDELSRKSLDEIEREMEAASTEGRTEPDPQKAEQARVREALCRLELLERARESNKGARERGLNHDVEGASVLRDGSQEEPAMRLRLQEIHREIQAAKEARQEFLRRKIKLSWRVRR